MSSIDERIVEIKFDNGNFEKGVMTTIKSLNELEKSMDLKASGKGLAELEKFGKADPLNTLASSVDALSGKFSVMSIAAVTAISKITSAAMDAGAALVKSLTIDQVTAGFTKYEQKTASVQTIMAATGMSIEKVEEQLSRLTFFTDETSYSFTDMVNNIGKFTSQGQDLDKSVTAMQGIATWAAKSGQGTNEASRAMYNLAQSLGKGHVELIDWKSIQNANMDTIEFKQTVIDTAKELGALSKEGKTAGKELVTTSNFAETLTKGKWFTNEVLMATLSKYGEFADAVYKDVEENGGIAATSIAKLEGSYGKLGVSAFKAAQQAKTFTEVIAATKDAVSSGWMVSFEHVFGNYEEAVVLWSDMAEKMWEIFAEGAEARNDLLSGWKEAGGRDDLIEGFMNLLDVVKNIKAMVSDAFSDLFPPATVDTLTSITAGFKDFTGWLKDITSFGYETPAVFESFEAFDQAFKASSDGFLSGAWLQDADTFNNFIDTMGIDGVKKIEATGEALTNTFNGKNLKKGVKDSEEDIKALQTKLKELGMYEGEIDGIFGSKTDKAVRAYQKEKKLLVDGIFGKDTFASLFGGEKNEGFSMFLDQKEAEASIELQRKFGGEALKVQNIMRGAFATLRIGSQVFGFLGGAIGKVGQVLKPVGSLFLDIGSAIGSSLVDFSKWIDESKIFDTALGWIENALKPVTGWLEKGSTAIKDFFGIKDGKFDGATLAARFQPVIDLWEKGKKAFADSKVAEKFKESWSKIGKALEPARKALSKHWETLKKYAGEKTTELFGKIGEALPGIFEKVGKGIEKFVTWVTPHLAKLPALMENVKSFFKGLWESTSTDASGAVTKMSGPLKKAFEWIKNLYESLKGSEKFQAIVEKLKATFETVKKAISDFFGSFGKGEEGEEGAKTVTTVFDKLKEALKGTEGFTDTLKTIYENVKNAVQNFGIGKILGILAGVGFGVTLWKTISSVGKAFTSIGGFFDTIRKKLPGSENEKPMDSLGTTLLKIAGSIALIAGAIYFLGSMDYEVFKRGAITVAAVAAVLAAFVSFSATMSKDQAANVTATGNAIKSIAIAIGVITAAIFVLGNMNTGKLLKGAGAVAGIMVALAIMSRVMGKMDVNVKLSGLFKMALAIGVIAIIAGLVGKMDTKQFWTGLLRLSAIMVVMGLLMRGIARAGGNVKISGMLGMAVAIGILVLLAKQLGDMDSGKALQGIGGLVAIMTSFGLMMRLIGRQKMSTSALAGMLLGMVGLAALMFAFAEAMNRMPNVDATKIGAFAGGLSALLLSMSVFMRLTGSMNIGSILTSMGALLAVVGTIALVIAAFGALDKIPGFTDFMKGGASSLGQIIGSFIAGIRDALSGGGTMDTGKIDGMVEAAEKLGDLSSKLPASKGGIDGIIDFVTGGNLGVLGRGMQQFANGYNGFVQALSTLDVPEDLQTKTENAVKAAQAIADFSAGLPEEGTGERITAWLFGSELAGFSADMPLFGEGVSAFITTMSSLTVPDDLGSKTEKAMAAAQAIADFSAGLPQKGAGEAITEAFTGSELYGMAQDIPIMGQAIVAFTTALSGLTVPDDLSTKTETALKALQQIADFGAGLPQKGAGEAIVESFTGSELYGMSQDIPQMAQAITAYTTALSGITIPDDLSTKTEKALGALQQIADFGAGLPQKGAGEAIVESFTGSELQNFADTVPDMATAITTYSNALSGLTIPEDLSSKTESALTALQAVADFGAGLPQKGAGEKIVEFFTGSELQNFADEIPSMVSAIETYVAGISDLSIEEGFADKSKTAIDAVTSIQDFLSKLGGSSEVKDAMTGSGALWWSDSSSFTKVMDALSEIGTKVNEFSAKTAGADISGFVGVMNGLAGLTTVLQTVSANPPTEGISSLKTMIDDISDLFGSTDTTIDTSKITPLQEALTSVTDLFSSDGVAVDTSITSTLKQGLNDISSMFSDLNVTVPTATIESLVKAKEMIVSALTAGEEPKFVNLTQIQFKLEELKLMFASDKIGEVNTTMYDPLITALNKIKSALAVEGEEAELGSLITLKLRLMDLVAIFSPDMVTDVNPTQYDAMFAALSNFTTSLSTLGESDPFAAIATLKQAQTDLLSLFSGEGSAKIDSEKFMAGFDAAVVAAKISEAASTISAAAASASGDMTTAASNFNGTGAAIANGIAAGVSSGGSAVNSAVSSVVSGAVSAGSGATSQFTSIGSAMAQGIVNGLNSKAGEVAAAAARIASAAAAAARAAADIHSPSRVFAEIGKLMDEGWSQGIAVNGKSVTDATTQVADNAIVSAKNVLSNFSAILSDEIQTDPVIKPVVDLTDVQKGAKQIGGIMTDTSSISMSGIGSRNLASNISVGGASDKPQNGNPNNGDQYNSSELGLLLTGNTFNVRSENDVHLLASELATLTKQGQRALGAPNP